jgi:hypothetical protein
MAYVEFLWTRKMFAWYVGIGIAAAAVLLVAAIDMNLHPSQALRRIPFGVVFGVAGYAGCIMTTLIAATLNRDREHLAYIWTRPVPRARIAFQYMSVDVLTIVVAFFVTAAIATVVIGNWPHSVLVADPNMASLLVRYLAIPLMWYGLVEAATSWNALKGPAAAGIAWGVFWILLLASAISLPAPVTGLVAALNLLNPLAYFLNVRGEIMLLDPVSLSEISGRNLITLGYTLQTILAYAIFIGGCAAATYAWRRMEA